MERSNRNQMGNILFTHSYFYRYDPKQWNNKTPFPPLGTLYAASILRELDHSVSLWDSNLKEDHNDIEEVIKRERPSYFVCYDDGFNYLTKMCLTEMRQAAFDMFKLAKKAGAKVIVCSSDSTDHYENYHQEGADFVIHGEGEITLVELIKSLESDSPAFNSIDGISFLDDKNNVCLNPRRKNLKELDDLPSPAWDLVDIDAYKSIWKEGGKEFTLNIATTRGCPFKCNWCAKPIYGQRYNSRSAKNVVSEIEFLMREFGVKRFWMCDDIFGLKNKWVQEFNTLVQSKNLKFSYYIQSRADLLLKEDSIEALAASGLDEVWIGAESGSQRILDAMDKGITLQQIEEATFKLQKYGVKVCFFIQFGYLGEQKEDIALTIQLIKKLKPHNIGVSVSYPLPGTPFYDKVKQELDIKTNWTDSDELAMMFEGTFNTSYYKKLHRYVHKEFRISKGLESIRNMDLTKNGLRSILLLGYYIPSALKDKRSLDRMDNLAS